MAHVNSDAASFKVDDSTGAIATISGSVNNVTVDGGTNLLDDTGLGDARHTVINGLGIATNVTVNGWLDTTTEAIFAPVVDQTSITKTIDVGLVSGQFLSGEAWPESVSLGASIDSISTWSVTFRAQDGMTRTSVAQS
jgi:hypothetical protein